MESKNARNARAKKQIESQWVAIDSIAPHPRNTEYHAHPDAQIDMLAQSGQTFGQYKNVVIWKKQIIAGAGIWAGLKRAGATEIEVKDYSHLTQAQAFALMTSDNETQKGAVTNDAELAALVREVLESGDEALARLAAGEQKALDALLAQANGKEETADVGELVDKAAELQKKWQCAKGDIWTSAGHYWICGDCREFETWQKLLSAAQVEKVNGVFTSPPYAEQRKKQYGGVPTDKYVEWWNEVQANVRAHLAADGSFFVNIKPHCENGERVLYVFDLVLAMKRQWGWKFIDELSWNDVPIPGKWDNRFKNGFEPVYHFGTDTHIKFRAENVSHYGETFKADGRTHFSGNGAIKGAVAVMGNIRPSNVIQTGTSDGVHEASFPIALPSFFIKAYSDAGDVWCDPFLGSGTTICAAHKNNRRGLGIEFLEKYCAVICERIEKETGETPRRVETNGHGKKKTRVMRGESSGMRKQ